MDFNKLFGFWLTVFGFFVFTNAMKHGGRFEKNGRRVQSLKAADVEANLGWVTQEVDHFDLINTDTWLQKYYWNDKNYQASGPIFIFYVSIGSSDGYYVEHGAMMELCEEVRCIAFELEHRFYGESWPVNDTTVDTLRYYSTIEQALGDVANFIPTIKEKFSLQNNKVLLVGKGYSGFLVAAAREKFPHLVNAAWASSAPLKQVYDFPEYFETVGRVIRDISQDCYDTIQEGFREIEKLAIQGDGCRRSESHGHGGTRLDLPSDPLGPQGCPLLQRTFNLCQLLDLGTYNVGRDNIRGLLEALAQDFAGLVQFNSEMGENSIANQCRLIFDDTSKGLSPLMKLAKFNNVMNELNGLPCTDFKIGSFCKQFTQTVNQPPTRTSPMLFSGPRQYFWLMCSQIGLFQSSAQPFGTNFKVDFVGQRKCGCAFGKSIFTESRIQENIKNTLETYGGLALAKKTSKIAFVSGLNDPWSPASVLDPEEASKSNLVIAMKGLSQALDLNPSSADDPPVLTAARAQVKSQIKEWLGSQRGHGGASGVHSWDNREEDEEFWRSEEE